MVHYKTSILFYTMANICMLVPLIEVSTIT